MKHNRPLKASSYYSLILGLINLTGWIILILTGHAGDFQNEPVASIFHLVSEFITAVLLITTGVLLLHKKIYCINYMFLSFGFLLMGIGGAFFYYISNFDIALFIFSSLITGATIILIILNYRSLKDIIFISLGVSIYGLLNILGNGLQEMNIILISMSIPALIFLINVAFSLLHKEIVFRKLTKQ